MPKPMPMPKPVGTIKEREDAILRLITIIRSSAMMAADKKPKIDGRDTGQVVLAMGIASLIELGVTEGEIYLATLKTLADELMAEEMLKKMEKTKTDVPDAEV